MRATGGRDPWRAWRHEVARHDRRDRYRPSAQRGGGTRWHRGNQYAKVQASDVAAIADLGLDRRRVAEWRELRDGRRDWRCAGRRSGGNAGWQCAPSSDGRCPSFGHFRPATLEASALRSGASCATPARTWSNDDEPAPTALDQVRCDHRPRRRARKAPNPRPGRRVGANPKSRSRASRSSFTASANRPLSACAGTSFSKRAA
jgi:hypothetical protein